MSANEIDVIKQAYRDFIAEQLKAMVTDLLLYEENEPGCAEQGFRGALRMARQARDKMIAIVAEENTP